MNIGWLHKILMEFVMVWMGSVPQKAHVLKAWSPAAGASH
jgi:hypothetical protein